MFLICTSSIQGELFAQAPVEEYPGVAVEAVMDSSRYFVVKIVDPSGKILKVIIVIISLFKVGVPN